MTIGIMGFEDGEYATILSVALAVMASSGRWKRILILEMNQEGRYYRIGHFYKATMKNAEGCFQIDRIEFVPNAGIKDAMKWAAQEGVFLVLDCGSDLKAYQSINHICNQTILLCNLLPWKLNHVVDILEQRKFSWNKILVTRGKSNIDYIQRKTGYHMTFWKGIEDPFCLSKEKLRELYQLIQGKSITTK